MLMFFRSRDENQPMNLRLGLLMSLMLFQVEAHAQQHSISGKLGLLGLGIEYSYAITERLAVRGMLYGAGYSFDAEESGIEYDFDLDWDSLSVALDFHPLANSFRLSAGLMKNDNGLRAHSAPTQNITIGDTTYTPAEIGSLDGRIGFDGISPFVGLGWDWSRSRRFGATLDLGLVRQGSPDVSLSATGLLQSDPDFRADVRKEADELEAALDNFDLLPYVTVGVTFRF